jgi:lysophospholipase L1-like esterase
MTPSRILIIVLLLALTAPAAAHAAPHKRYLVALGDSYATGYQPTAVGQGQNTRNGFAYQVPKLAKARGYDLRLVNFGCGGATTVSLLQSTAECGGKALGGPDYTGRTQIAAAEEFLRSHRGKVDLITVSISGNDVTACARAADPVACVAMALPQVEQNVRETAQRLRMAGGAKPRIVGITYPDVILGKWVGADASQELAKLSVVAFKNLINPALARAYEAGGGRLVDVTKATGAYGSLEETTTLEPYGAIPVPVAKVCRLSYYCEFRDIHARTKGYRLIAKLVVKTLPRRAPHR